MQIVQVKPREQSVNKLVFQDSALAHKYCVGEGLEIGAAAHNPFNLKDCLNVSDPAGFEYYKQSQVDMCGAYAEADLLADAANIPFGDGVEDYVISSHMLEHHPNPLACLQEWGRLVRDGGIVFIIVPKRNAHSGDVGRPVTTAEEFKLAFAEQYTVETAPPAVNGGVGGHYHVYDLENLRLLVDLHNDLVSSACSFDVIELLETDDKVGNGHLLVLRKDAIPMAQVEVTYEVPVKRGRKPKAKVV